MIGACTRARAGHSHADSRPNTHGVAPAAPAPAHPTRVSGAQEVRCTITRVPRRGTAKTAKSVAFQVCTTVRILRNLMNCVHNVNFASFAKKKSGKQGLQSVTI